MGFMDKAKKMAEQAQAKLDEAQKQFNQDPQQNQPSGPAVEYDAHGRPIPQAAPESTVPPHGDPLAGQQPPAPPVAQPGVPPSAGAPPAAQPGVPPSAGAPPVVQPGVAPGTDEPPPSAEAPAPPAGAAPAPSAPPAQPAPDAADEDRNHPSYAPPKLSSGDPLAG